MSVLKTVGLCHFSDLCGNRNLSVCAGVLSCWPDQQGDKGLLPSLVSCLSHMLDDLWWYAPRSGELLGRKEHIASFSFIRPCFLYQTSETGISRAQTLFAVKTWVLFFCNWPSNVQDTIVAFGCTIDPCCVVLGIECRVFHMLSHALSTTELYLQTIFGLNFSMTSWNL